MARLVTIHGERGRWVAQVDGVWLGVLHQSFRVGLTGSRAPISSDHPGQKRFQELVAALRTYDLVVMQRDKDTQTLARDGYVGVFRFKDLVIDTATHWELTLTLTERYASPKAR